jgi:Holliday junction resolvase
MPNANYARGVRYERQIMAQLKASGYSVVRASGSHGLFDVIAFRSGSPVIAVQCKCSKTLSKAKAEERAKAFVKAPPLSPSIHFSQVISIYAMKDKAVVEGIA